MSPDQHRSPNRLLAPIALAAVVVAFWIIVAASGGGDDGDGGKRTEPAAQRTTTTAPRPRVPRAAAYTVKTGDNLGAIAERTGVSVERLRELNPALDPQALVTGQKIKLRE